MSTYPLSLESSVMTDEEYERWRSDTIRIARCLEVSRRVFWPEIYGNLPLEPEWKPEANYPV